MLSFARLCLLAVSLALLVHLSSAASLGYTAYNNTGCTGPVLAFGTDYNATYTSAGGYQTWQGSCFQVTNIAILGASYAQIICTEPSYGPGVSAMYYFQDSNCNLFMDSFKGSGPNTCAASGQTSPIPTIYITCNGAYAMAALSLSLPLMALLAVVVVAIISS